MGGGFERGGGRVEFCCGARFARLEFLGGGGLGCLQLLGCGGQSGGVVRFRLGFGLGDVREFLVKLL